MTEHELLFFLDAYQGYHQMALTEQDINKVIFITSDRTSFYVVMPFGIKNAKATYQILMDKFFKYQICWNMDVYVDGILIKAKATYELINDLEETLFTIPNYILNLNPSKWLFWVQTCKFLGYMITQKGIESRTEKIHALTTLISP